MKHLRYIFLLYIINLTFSCSTVINADLLIIDGIVYDGIDSRSKIVDIAIKDDKIIYVGKNRRHSIKTNKIINAKDLIISPGFIDTVMTEQIDEKFKETIIAKIPSNRLGKPEDIANAVIFLSSNLSDYINGETVHVNGGMYLG